jgi:hypothetical protein
MLVDELGMRRSFGEDSGYGMKRYINHPNSKAPTTMMRKREMK